MGRKNNLLSDLQRSFHVSKSIVLRLFTEDLLTSDDLHMIRRTLLRIVAEIDEKLEA